MNERPIDRHARSRGVAIALVAATILRAATGSAQSTAAGPLSVNDAVQLALKNYPRIIENRARANAADAGVALARTSYLPRLDMVWQENRATHNNVFGLLLPQS